MRQRLDDLFHQAGLVPNIRIETPTVLSACQLALQGMGITLTDPFIANVFDCTDLTVRPLAPGYKITYGVLYLRQTPPRRLARQFIDVTKQVAQEIAVKQAALY